ncbi:MAG: SMP-30/gluconolactonase/LRE family protein [Rhodobacteraceae bacterium]|nr:SMP-30/gluconolactonase/LRE family protein [Paracoccaceae bacterium]
MAGIAHLAAPRCSLGEGASYDAQSGELSWVDIPESRAFGWNGTLSAYAAAEETAFIFRLSDGTRVEGGAGGIVVGGKTYVPPGLGSGEALNDAAVHPSGRMAVIGSRHRAERERLGQCWILSSRGWERMDQRFTVFNGPAFSPGGEWLYYADSAERTIWRRAVLGESFALGPATAFAQITVEAGYPDGAAIDDAGFLWSTHWDGARLTRYRPDGMIERVVALPVARPTSLAFFGADLDQIAVTTALPDGANPVSLPETDLSGRLLLLSAGISGPSRPRLNAGLILG